MSNIDKKTELYIDAWKEAVNVQMHFNEMEMKIRGLAISIILALLGAVGFAYKTGINIKIFEVNVSLSSIMIFLTIFSWLAFYFMDRFWYHNLLLGAVAQGVELENKLKEEMPEIRLGTHIGNYSPNQIASFESKKLSIHSSQKITLFYIGIPLTIVISLKIWLNYGILSALIAFLPLLYMPIVILAFISARAKIKSKKKLNRWLRNFVPLIAVLYLILCASFIFFV